MSDLSAYASALGIKPPRPSGNPPPGSGIVTADQQRPDTYDGSPGDIAELRQAAASAPDASARRDLTALLQKKTQAADQSARLSPYAQALGVAAPAPQAPAAPYTPTARESSTEGIPQSLQGQTLKPRVDNESLWDKVVGAGEAALTTVTGIPAGVYGTVVGLSHELTGRGDGDKAAGESMAANTYAPRTEAGQRYAEKVGEVGQGLMAIAPLSAELSMFGKSAKPAARQVADAARKSVDTSMDAARAKFAGKAAAERVEPTVTPSAAPEAIAAETVVPSKKGAPVAFDTPPVEGGLDKSARFQRAMVLKRVGIEDARESALNGDAGSAARDFQVTKFEEPAGIKAKAQFDAEKQALVNHGEGIIQKTGGSLGLDEASLNTRGQVVAAPFDALGDWFTKKTGELYATAEERSQGMPNVQPASLEALLNDRSFKNQLTATNQGHVLQGVADELANFKETNPNGITVKNAEQFRQFLNTLWTKDTSKVIARMKDALDDDVFKSAGEDVFSDARKLYQQREATLSNPKGVARLMDTDPQTPINRVTAFDKIPDTLTKLSPDQFRNILETLDGMPAELQPLAAAAKAEIKAQLANRALEAGAKDKGAWNNKSVNKFIKDHSAKLAIAFEDQPELATSLRDMQAAGNILSYDQSYPGAAAQAANAMKRGLMSRSAGPALGTAGAATGGFLFGPGGAALGGGVGTMLGTKAGSAISEGAALKKWQGGVTRIADMPGVK